MGAEVDHGEPELGLRLLHRRIVRPAVLDLVRHRLDQPIDIDIRGVHVVEQATLLDLVVPEAGAADRSGPGRSTNGKRRANVQKSWDLTSLRRSGLVFKRRTKVGKASVR